MGEERDEPSANPLSVESDGSGTYCEQCGEGIDTTDWYPITTERGADGSLRIYEFCSETCKAARVEE